MNEDEDFDDSMEIEVVQEDALESAAPDRLVRLYESTLRAVSAFPELQMRRARLDDVLRRIEPEEAVWFIDQLVRGALWGRTAEVDALLATSSWLIRLRIADEYELLQELYIAAHQTKRDSILSMLRDFPAHQALGPGVRLPDIKLPIPREVTLGEKRSLAAGQDRRILERLIHDNSPLVIEKLMRNPLIQIQDVIAIASRRPTQPELLIPILMSDSWFIETRVRETLVQNPYVPTGVALRVLPTLHTTILRKLRFSGDLHPEIAEKAALYVQLREQRTAPWGH